MLLGTGVGAPFAPEPPRNNHGDDGGSTVQKGNNQSKVETMSQRAGQTVKLAIMFEDGTIHFVMGILERDFTMKKEERAHRRNIWDDFEEVFERISPMSVDLEVRGEVKEIRWKEGISRTQEEIEKVMNR